MLFGSTWILLLSSSIPLGSRIRSNLDLDLSTQNLIDYHSQSLPPFLDISHLISIGATVETKLTTQFISSLTLATMSTLNHLSPDTVGTVRRGRVNATVDMISRRVNRYVKTRWCTVLTRTDGRVVAIHQDVHELLAFRPTVCTCSQRRKH